MSCRIEIAKGKLNCFLTCPGLIGTKDKNVGGESDENDFTDHFALYARGLGVSPREISQIA